MLLKLGSKGDDVKKLQEKLGLNPDGNFGPNTEKTVKDWQSKNGLTSDGVVGDATWVKLFGNSTTTTQPVVSNGTLKLEKLKGVIPDGVIAQIPDTAAKFNITTNLRLAHFLSQCAHESGNFKSVFENLNYSESGLLNTFKKYFTPELAKKYSKKPEMIASRVYSNRMGNGSEETKDGWKFRGRGYLQCTGKSNYDSLSKKFGVDFLSNPDLISTDYPLSSAGWFFDKNKLWSICDKGSTDDVVKELTKRINGGYLGLNDRIKKFNKFWNLLK